MKPRIFIGSSAEGLDIANAIQENLAYDSNPTIWTQGIFQLSSNSLDDLINALDKFDFGIFVFKLDDFILMRNDKLNVVRDNVIFELGMFIGKLGKDRVFFVLPNEVDNFHLPTDLTGVMAGKYDNKRVDTNAALGPFCNQVRQRIRDFVFQNLSDLSNESKEAKQIVIEKKPCWEMHLFAALLRPRMIEINRGLDEVMKGYIFRKTVFYNMREVNKWFQITIADILRLIEIAGQIYQVELFKSFGEPGVAGNIFEIKSVADKVASLCKELLTWEVELQSVKLPEELQELKTLMKGWSNNIISEFTKLPKLLEEGFSEENVAKGALISIELTFEPPSNSDRINELFAELTKKSELGLIRFD